jgi:hypothetical protein
MCVCVRKTIVDYSVHKLGSVPRELQHLFRKSVMFLDMTRHNLVEVNGRF